MRVQQLISAHLPSVPQCGTTRTGRGAAENPSNRFEKIHLEPDADQSSFYSDSTSWNPEDNVLPRSQLYQDHSHAVIARNDSPDIAFETSLNSCRRCNHELSTAAFCRPPGAQLPLFS